MNKKFIALAIWTIFVTMMLIKHNPFLLTNSLLPSVANHEIWETEGLTAISKKPTSDPIYYRQNEARNPIFQVDRIPKILSKYFEYPRLNLGIHGASKASVIADETGFYVGNDTGVFYGFNPNGTIRWSYQMADTQRGIHSTAVIWGPFVIVGNYRGAIYKFDKLTGKLIWQKTVGHTIGSSPMIKDNDLVVAVETTKPDGYLIKLNALTGAIIWRSVYLGEQSHASPAWDKINKLYFIGVNNSIFYAFNDSDGSVAWSFQMKGPSKSTPVVAGDSVVATNWGKQLIKLDSKTGALIWDYQMDSSSQVSPVYLEKENLIVSSDSSGKLYGVDFTTGKTRWIWESDKKNKVDYQMSSPVIIEDQTKLRHILFYCQHNKFCLFDVKGKKVRDFKVGVNFTGSPFIFDNKLYVTCKNGPLEVFDLK